MLILWYNKSMDNQNRNNVASSKIVQDMATNLAIPENNEINNVSRKLGFWLFFVSLPLIMFSSLRLFSIPAILENGGGLEIIQPIVEFAIPIILFVFGVKFRRAKLKLDTYKKLTIATIVLCSISAFVFISFFVLGFFMVGFGGLACNNNGGATCAIAWGGLAIFVAYCAFQAFAIIQCFIKCIRLLSLLKEQDTIKTQN